MLGREPSDAAAARLYDESGGNPFYARQLAAIGETDAGNVLPPRLRDVLVTRLTALSEGTQQVLRVAAVGGPIVEERLLTAVPSGRTSMSWPSGRTAMSWPMSWIAVS